MQTIIEIYTWKPLPIKLDTYFSTALWANGTVIPGSPGRDEYRFLSIITGEKRVAALGREQINTLAALPAGMGPVETSPGEIIDLPEIAGDLALVLQTNLTENPGILADTLGIRFINQERKSIDLPLCRPDITVRHDGRETYTIALSGLLSF